MAASITLDQDNNRYIYKSDGSTDNYNYAVTFSTANTFVAQNIRVQIHPGSISPYFDNTNLATYFNAGTAGSNSISITPKATAGNGFINTLTSSNAQTGTAQYYTIKQAVVAADTADVTLFSTDGSNAGFNISAIVGTKTTTEPSSGYYLAFKGSGNSKITTAGWVETGSLTSTTSGAKYFPVTAAAGEITGTNTVTPSASLSGSNVTLSDTNNGISITATGGGTASVTAAAKINTAGYAPTTNSLFSKTLNASNNTTTATKYISAITIPSEKSLTITNNGTATMTTSGTANITSNSTTAGTITIAAKTATGDSSNTSQVVVQNGLWKTTAASAATTYYGRVTIRAVTGSIGGTATSGSATAVITNTNNIATISDLTNKTAGTDYWQIKATATGTAGGFKPKYTVTTSGWIASTVEASSNTSVSVTGDTTGKSLYIPKATFTVSGNKVNVNTAGYIASGTVGTITARNIVVSSTDPGSNYINKTDLVLPIGGWLKLDAGYYSAQRISLATLVPDSISGAANGFAPANYILAGYGAFDANGAAIIGTMPTYDGSYTEAT